MCGIVGIIDLNNSESVDLQVLQQAAESLKLRGPDDTNVYQHKNIGFGHTRLSIIDTSSAGSQPMMDETGRYVINYNGEIYNFRKIREELQQKGVQFKSESDTEVLLHQLILYGIDGLQSLNGFFAFAFYDSQEGNLLIARDRVGIKPLVYFQDADRLIFASEMKALLCFDIPKSIDYISLLQYLQLSYIPPDYGMLKGVKKLAPGNYLSIQDGKISEGSYYKIPYDPSKLRTNGISYESSQQTLHKLLDDSVRSRLYADVPVGAYLSGGIDSSILVHFPREFLPKTVY